MSHPQQKFEAKFLKSDSLLATGLDFVYMHTEEAMLQEMWHYDTRKGKIR